MLHAIKQNYLFIYKTIVILIMVFPFISEGATDLIPFSITSGGNISFECPDPTNLGYSNLWNMYMYETNNDFPNITRVVNSSVGQSIVCSAIQNQTAEGGWLNGGASTPDGYYAIVFTVNALEDPDYTMILQRSGGNWSALSGTSTPPIYNCDDPTTRILNFTPLDNSTTTSPVDFTLDACINESDLGTISTVNISLHNIDQNVLLLSDFSPSDIWLLHDRDIENAGLYSFATTTTLGDGNYRLEACIKRGYLWGFFNNPFSDISECTSHQFIVGQPTFIGNISQNIWGETNGFLEGLSATTSEALAVTCNPLGGSFDVRLCTTFLFVPDAKSLKDIMDNARNGILSRVPWGYFTRFAVIMTGSGTSTLPAWTVPIQVGAGSDMTPEITTISVDPSDMLAGGAQLLDSVRDPITNKSARDVFKPMVQLTIALAVLLTIVADLARMHNHSNEDRGKNSKYT